MKLTQNAIQSLLNELIDGPQDFGCWVIDRDEPGLLGVLSSLSATQASQAPATGRKSIAAHVNHLSYALSLLNRWAGGEENPFATADWEGSWKLQEVDEGGWQALIRKLADQAHAWRDAAQQPRQWDEISLTGAIASTAHMAYHFGAIKQIAFSIE